MTHWWATEDFAVGHKAIRQNGCSIQKSLISIVSFGELTKIGDSIALTFFSEIRAKIALPELKTFLLKIRAITGHTALTQKWRRFFFAAEGHRAMVEQQWSTEQWPMGHANF